MIAAQNEMKHMFERPVTEVEVEICNVPNSSVLQGSPHELTPVTVRFVYFDAPSWSVDEHIKSRLRHWSHYGLKLIDFTP